MLSRDQDRVVRAEANILLDELGVTTYPIDPDAIARQKEVVVQDVPGFPDGVYGALCRKDSRFEILVSDRCPNEGMRRFSVSHELGHYMLPGHVDEMFRKSDELIPSTGGHYRRKDRFELEADTFASELLVPTRFARQIVRAGRPTLESIITLSETFNVSLVAAAIRTVELTDEAMAIVLSHDGTCEWCSRSPALAEHAWSKKVLKREMVPLGSATRRLSKDTHGVQRLNRVTDTSPLSIWFDEAPGDLEVVEEAMGLGEYGRVMTVMTFEDVPDSDELYLREQRLRRREVDDAIASQAVQSTRGDWRRPLRDFHWDDEEE